MLVSSEKKYSMFPILLHTMWYWDYRVIFIPFYILPSFLQKGVTLIIREKNVQ